tara:strand:+ start:422 stop:820 length:399 start_codon:yes stop_codon:yes gene_type:complete
MGKALDLIGDRWSLLIVRDLTFKGFHEFREFLESGEGIASNILSARLKKLGETGIIDSAPHPTDGKKKLYYLTERGKGLLPIMIEMTLWGIEHTRDNIVPEEILNGMQHHREAFSTEVHKKLEAWEEEYLTT